MSTSSLTTTTGGHQLHLHSGDHEHYRQPTRCENRHTSDVKSTAKGKRSASDQMHEAVNYISHLKNNVKELEIKRDNLKKLSASSSTTTATGTGSIRSSADNRHRSSSVTVSQCRGGMEVLINSCGFGEEGGLHLSKVFGVLTERGLNVVSYVSSEVNGRLFHAIRSELSDLMYIDLFELEQKLSGLINGSTSEQLQ